MKGKLLNSVRQIILLWFQQHSRVFPWRRTKDPYKIMIAEFMLHRTKAEQVVPVYREFIKLYPDVFSLANASYNEVKKVTEHLGLHWRAKHFPEAARYIVKNLKGEFPENYNELRKIPGFGEYIAGAISVICFNKPAPVVDSNIARFINRVWGLNLKGELRRKKEITRIAKILFDCEKPGQLLFSIIDFTSAICKPRNPECSNCILKNMCKYFQNKNSGTTTHV